MRLDKIKIALAILAVVWGIGYCLPHARADGLPTRGSVTSDTPTGAVKWTGFYIGGGAGHTWWSGNQDEREGSGTLWKGELKAGFDVKLGSTPWIMGVFGTWTPNMLITEKRVNNIYGLGGRIGYVTGNNVLFYGGAKWVRVDEGNELGNLIPGHADGWEAIAGFEQPLFANITWGLEYDYIKLDDNRVGVDLDAQSVMARVNFRF